MNIVNIVATTSFFAALGFYGAKFVDTKLLPFARIVHSAWRIAGGIDNPTLRRRTVDTYNRVVFYVRAKRSH